MLIRRDVVADGQSVCRKFFRVALTNFLLLLLYNYFRVYVVSLSCFIHSIQVRYGSTWAPLHGYTSVSNVEVLLNANEVVTSIAGRSGWVIDQFTFTTNLQRTLGPYGGSGGGNPNITPPPVGTWWRYITGAPSDIEISYLNFWFA